MNYRIYRIWVVGKRVVLRPDIEVESIEIFRKETAETFRVSPSRIRLQYDHLNEKWDDLKHPIPSETKSPY